VRRYVKACRILPVFRHPRNRVRCACLFGRQDESNAYGTAVGFDVRNRLELRLVIQPIVLGSGKSLFKDVSQRQVLQLKDVTLLGRDTVRLTYTAK
jgi:hypothetical protein